MRLINEEQRQEVQRKIAYLVLAKGTKMPDFLATLDLQSRIIVVNSFTNFGDGTQIGPELITAMIAYPQILSQFFDDPATKDLFEAVGKLARYEISRWSEIDLKLDVAHLISQALGEKPHPAQNARYN
jgi:hypothetical protein